MLDGPTKATDLDRTEENRELIRSFVDDVLATGRWNKLDQIHRWRRVSSNTTR